MELDQLINETKEIVLKGKYPEIFNQLEKIFLLIEEQQKELEMFYQI